jgi:hypothetical protein
MSYVVSISSHSPNQVSTILTVSAFVITLSNEWVKSTHGDIKTAPEGMGSSVSRIMVRRVSARAPPAESPPRIMCLGLIAEWSAPGGGRMRYKSARVTSVQFCLEVFCDIHAARQSCRGHGQGYCGALR